MVPMVRESHPGGALAEEKEQEKEYGFEVEMVYGGLQHADGLLIGVLRLRSYS